MGSRNAADEGDSSWELVENVETFRPFIVDGYNESFKCAICLECMCEPVSIHPCGHMFDAECIKQHRASKGRQATCPKGCPDPIKAVVPAPDMKQVIRETVKVKCPNKECRKRMVADAMTAHLEVCSHSRYRCTREDDDGEECDETVLRKDMARHDKECKMVRVDCPNAGCTERPARGCLEYHVEDYCDHRMVECEWCEKEFKSKDIDEHDDNCPEKEVPCLVCKGHGDACYFLRKELDAHLADHKYLGRHLEFLRETITANQKAHFDDMKELTTRATLKINPEHNTIQDPDTVAISGSFEMTWTVDVAKARRKGTKTGLVSPTFEFGGFLFHLVFKISASSENDWSIFLGCARRAHDLGGARRVTELRALFTLFTRDWSLTRDCDDNLWPDYLLGGRGPSLTPGQKVLVVGIRMRQLRVKHEFRTDDSEAFMSLKG